MPGVSDSVDKQLPLEATRSPTEEVVLMGLGTALPQAEWWDRENSRLTE